MSKTSKARIGQRLQVVVPDEVVLWLKSKVEDGESLTVSDAIRRILLNAREGEMRTR